MKSLFFSLFFSALLIFAGCSDNTTGVNQPTTSNKKIIKMLPKKGFNLGLQLSKSQRINGEQGGSILLIGDENSSDGNNVFYAADLQIPSGAFLGSVDFTITTDPQDAAIIFTPHMVFLRPLNLDLTFSDLDLSQIDLSNGNVGFYYVDDNDNYTPVENDGVHVNISTGTISVKNAQINHFSRYAFAQ